MSGSSSCLPYREAVSTCANVFPREPRRGKEENVFVCDMSNSFNMLSRHRLTVTNSVKPPPNSRQAEEERGAEALRTTPRRHYVTTSHDAQGATLSFLLLWGLLAVGKPTYGALPPPTGLECEQEIRQQNKTKTRFYYLTQFV